ncbi:MAG: hypothetical protein ACK45T_00150 [Pseudanabaena sp.]|jgi:hypothetical protein|nr:hypothetical protein [Pseudanabaena sp. M53BS1SP1A06MG]MCA6584513.1 hypothetical protein [Pseudanabaena sp. M34BS1SP1A06MG]MCA6593571.1 hypothetical protein [Pseudanabaena sp. M38BS1SP1A06MG]
MLSGAAIHQQAKSVVILAEKLVVSLLRQNFFQMFKISPTDFEKAMRIAKFERHFRAIDLNLDNESINSDLVKEYDSNHDDS